MAPTPSEASLDKRRWLVMSICLHIVVTPPLREIVAKKMVSLYDLMKRKNKIDTQTYLKYLEKLPGGRRDLNYESINRNDRLESSDLYDYKVGDVVSFAKLFVQPFMAKFTAFDDSFDTSAALAVLSYEGLFKPQVTNSARDVNFHVRTEWAHPNFTAWTAEHYDNCFRFLVELVSQLSRQFPHWTDNTRILGRLQWWKDNGTDFCSGRLNVPDFLRDCLEEVKAFSKAFADLRETLTEEVERQISETLKSFECDVRKEVELLKSRQSKLEENQNQEIKERRDGQEDLNRDLRAIHREIAKVKSTVDSLRSKHSKLVEAVEKVKNQQEEQRGKREIFSEQLSSLQTFLRELEKKIDDYNSVTYEKFLKLENENKALKETVFAMQKELKDKQDKTEIIALKETIRELQVKFESLTTNDSNTYEQIQDLDRV